MALSDDLASIEAYMAACAAGRRPLTPRGIGELRIVLGGLAERAAAMERALADTAEQLSPGRDRAALAAGMLSGKVALLDAHRVRRVPDIDPSGWTA